MTCLKKACSCVFLPYWADGPPSVNCSSGGQSLQTTPVISPGSTKPDGRRRGFSNCDAVNDHNCPHVLVSPSRRVGRQPIPFEGCQDRLGLLGVATPLAETPKSFLGGNARIRRRLRAPSPFRNHLERRDLLGLERQALWAVGC